MLTVAAISKGYSKDARCNESQNGSALASARAVCDTHNPAGTGSLPEMPTRLALSLDPPLCSPGPLSAALGPGSVPGEPVAAAERLTAVICRRD